MILNFRGLVSQTRKIGFARLRSNIPICEELRGVFNKFCKKILEVLVEVSVIFFKFKIFIPDYFSDQLMSIISLLKCYELSPDSNQLCSSLQEHFESSLKLDPSESVLDPFRAIKRNEKKDF